VEDTNGPDGNVFADKVKINLNMLGALMLNKVGGEVDGADVVAEVVSHPLHPAAVVVDAQIAVYEATEN
jgi:hypothetical protein